MKKLLAIIMLVATTVAGFSQDGNLKKQTYFRVGLSVPTWKYRGNDSKCDLPDQMKRTGGLFEVGHIYMLNKIKIANGMRIGINVDFLSLDYHRFSVKSAKYSSNFVYVGSKIGPSFSYSPVKRLVFDTYFKFNPVWVAGNATLYNSELTKDELYMGFMGLKYSVGLNVRYSILMLGFEFNPGFAKLRKYDTDENKLTENYMSNVGDNGKKTNVPGFNITLGLSF
jgi:hypothetical protein